MLKVINKAKSQMPPEELQLEIDTLKALDHPHIIRLFEYFEDYNNVYIIMETARGGELLDEDGALRLCDPLFLTLRL